MNLLSRRLAFLGAAGALVATGVLFACSTDDTVVLDSPPDGSVPDATPTARDATPDGDSATAPPITTDASITVEEFPARLARAMCRSLARCCFGNADLDGGAPVDAGTPDDAGTPGDGGDPDAAPVRYDQSLCVQQYTKFGFAGSNPRAIIDAGSALVAIDEQAASDCLARIDAIPCGDISSAQYKEIRDTCFSVLTGRSQRGEPCNDSIHCGNGLFCDKSDGGDAGPGVCDVVRGTDQSCGSGMDPRLSPDYAAEVGEEICSYRGGGGSGRYCTFYDFVTNDFVPQAQWKCANARGDTQECANTAWCVNALCYTPDDNVAAHCRSSAPPIFDSFTCGLYRH